jgi:hypothetical protein
VLAVELLDASEIDKAATTFHRDGFVCVRDLLTPEQLRFAQAGANRVIKEQTDADPERKGNRGSYRYSFGPQSHHPEWAMLLDLENIHLILDKIFGSKDYFSVGAGGDYSLPGAQIQPLHSDIGEFFHDPTGLATFHDVPAPFVVVNYTMVDFTVENGAIRFIPCTQRSRLKVPSLDEEPEWMKNNHVCAPAGAAVIRDVRCWHGGTANKSDTIRPMTSAGYFAPWYRSREPYGELRREHYEKMSERGRHLARAMKIV